MSNLNRTNFTPGGIQEKEKRVRVEQAKMLARAREIVRQEARALDTVAARLDEQICTLADHILSNPGLVVVSGVGKSGLVGQKISATLVSTGTRAVSLDPLDALHGGLGLVSPGDIFLALSNSGETEELRQVVVALRKEPVTIALITGNANSSLAQIAHSVLDIGPLQEAGALGLAPTVSTTAMMAVGDSLAIILKESRGYTRDDFARGHPSGNLGRKILRVCDLMCPEENLPIVTSGTKIAQALITMCQAPRSGGMAVVLNVSGKLMGVIDSRTIEHAITTEHEFDLHASVDAYIQAPPLSTIRDNATVGDAIEIFSRNLGDVLPVEDSANCFVGLLSRRELELAIGKADVKSKSKQVVL